MVPLLNATEPDAPAQELHSERYILAFILLTFILTVSIVTAALIMTMN